MTGKRIVMLAILLVGLLAIGVASAADNGTADIVSADDTTYIDGSLDEPQEDNVEISTSDEDSNKLSTENDDLLRETAYIGNNTDDIQSAISNTDADVIYLNGGTYTGGKDYIIHVDRPVTIEGNGSTITQVFFSFHSNVTVKNITFEDNGPDGCFDGVSNNIKIINCHFKANYAKCHGHSEGGAFGLLNNNPTNYNQIINCTFDSNYILGEELDNNPGDHYTGAGALLLEGPTQIINCSFNNNYFRKAKNLDDFDAPYFQGTAIFGSDNIQIINCTFNGNTRNEMPAGSSTVFLDNFNSKIINCSFVNNIGEGAIKYIDENSIFENGYYAYIGPEGVFYEFVPTNLTISVSNVTYGRYPVVRLTTDVPGNYSLTVAGKDYGIYELNRELQITVNELLNASNGYIACVKLVNAPEYYDSSIVNTTFNVNQASPNINVTFAEDFVMDYRDGSTWNITLLDTDANPISGASVKVGIKGKVYNRVTDVNGVARLPINLVPGVYEINATLEGDGNYEDIFVNGTVTVNKGIAVLSTSDLVMSYRDGSTWVVGLDDANGNAISGAYINANLSGKSYSIKTNSSGMAKIPINLAPGTYNVTATFFNAKYEAEAVSATITVDKATPVLTGADLVAEYRDGSAYSVTLRAADGNTLANCVVKITIGSKTYNRKTDANGVASLPINLAIGNYTITAKFEGNNKYGEVETSTTIVVSKPDLSIAAEDINMTCNDGINYTVQLTDKNGSPFALAGETIKVTIKGKTYNRKTNADGIATLPISLGAGTWNVTAEYNGKTITNTIVVNK